MTRVIQAWLYNRCLLGFSQDLRSALRAVLSQPAVSAIAILTLAIGIGADTAIFTVANTLLLRQLPYPEAERLALVSSRRDSTGGEIDQISWPRFNLIQERNRSFSGIAAFTPDTFVLTGHESPEELKAARVSWNFFQILGVRPAAGRWFLPQEDKPGGASVVVLSHEFWARAFGAQASAIGRALILGGSAYTVAGVLPAGFRFDEVGRVDIYAPRVFELSLISPSQLYGGAMFLTGVARLRPGVSFSQAQAEMNGLDAQYRREHAGFPDTGPGFHVQAANLRDQMVSSSRAAVWILFGAVSIVLLIACANVAGLLLSRALGRGREIAVRLALGASRADIIRQLLVESLLLAACAGALGGALAGWGARSLAAMAGDILPRSGEIHADGAVLGFTVLISLAAGALFGLAPALRLSRPDLVSALRTEGRGATAGRSRHVWRGLLVVGQIALSIVLLIGAGLLLRNFAHLRGDPGLQPSGVLTMNIALPATRYKRPEMAGFYNDLLAKVRAVPGVRAAAGSTALPLNPTRFTPALPEGQPEVPLAQRTLFNVQSITEGYAAVMGIPLLEGREFTAHDNAAGAPKVLLINRALAHRYWPGESAIGKRIWVGRDTQPWLIVGVLGDIRNINLAADVKPEIDLPYALLPGLPLNLIVRTAGDPHTMAKGVEDCVFSLDREQPVTAVRTMDEILSDGGEQPRFMTSLLTALALAALILAAVGVYGAIAYSVAERRQEMAIRMALGADRGGILGLVLRRGAVLAVAGIAIGLAAALLSTRFLASLLYGVSATDPVIFAAGALLFLCVALAASGIPAWRATTVDPAETLR